MSTHHVRKAAKNLKVLIIPASVDQPVRLVPWEDRGDADNTLYTNGEQAWITDRRASGRFNPRASSVYYGISTLTPPWATPALEGDYMCVGVTRMEGGHYINLPANILQLVGIGEA